MDADAAGIGNLAGTLRGDVGRLDEVVWGEATAVDRFRHGYSTPTTRAVCDQVPPCMRVSSISRRPGRRCEVEASILYSTSYFS